MLDIVKVHIGKQKKIIHKFKNSSPLMKPKQEEMDNIIKKIYSKLVERDKNKNESSLFLLCSDHGMNEVFSINMNNANFYRLAVMVGLHLEKRVQFYFFLVQNLIHLIKKQYYQLKRFLKLI